MLPEEKIKEIIIRDVYRRLDFLEYGQKHYGAGIIYYTVNKKTMTVSEYQQYCIKKELKKFGIK